MAKPTEIMDTVRVLMNDASGAHYTDAKLLPYFNIALNTLQEEFELHNIPVTNESTSAPILLPSGTTVLGFGTNPALPGNLVEIQQLWERTSGIIPYTEMSKQEFIPHSVEDLSITQFLIWAWVNQEIRLIESTADIEIKIDYIQSIFPVVKIDEVDNDIPVINIKSYLGYLTAALVSAFAGENESRASWLERKATQALDRALIIPIKGKQSISTRRRPYMSSYHKRGNFSS